MNNYLAVYPETCVSFRPTGRTRLFSTLILLQPYVGLPLPVGGELNKLAFNIGMARVMAGMHWRSDVIAGNTLGQAVALAILQDMHPTYNEPFSGFTLTQFDGTLLQS